MCQISVCVILHFTNFLLNLSYFSSFCVLCICVCQCTCLCGSVYVSVCVCGCYAVCLPLCLLNFHQLHQMNPIISIKYTYDITVMLYHLRSYFRWSKTNRKLFYNLGYFYQISNQRSGEKSALLSLIQLWLQCIPWVVLLIDLLG